MSASESPGPSPRGGGFGEIFEDVLRHSRSLVWEIDEEGVFTFASASFEAVLGYRPEEVVGVRNVDSFYPADLPPELAAELQGDWLRQKSEFRHPEVPLVAKDGAIVWVASSGVPVFDDDGQFKGYRGADIDITARKTQIDTLAANEQQLLRQLFEAPVAIAYTASGTDEMRVNRAFQNLFGYMPSEIPTIPEWFVRAYPDPVYREEVARTSAEWIARSSARGGPIEPREFKITCKDGTVRDVEIAAAMVGECFFGTFIDRTARNRAQRLLAASEASLRGLIDNAPLGIVRMDLATGRLWLNKVFTDLLGYTAEDVPDIGSWMLQAYPDPVYRERIMADWQEALREMESGSGKIKTSEVTVVDKTGAAHEMQFSGIIIGGEVFGLWVDLTARNRADRLLSDQQKKLAHVGRVAAVGQLTASLAHELNQPLGAIQRNAEAALEILRDKDPDLAELRSIIDDILADDLRAGNVIDRVRDFLRKDHKPSAETIDVVALVGETSAFVRREAAACGAVLEVSSDSDPARIRADRVLLQQALLNLLLNAVAAVPPGRGRIAVHAGDDGKGTVTITVTDNGGGLTGEAAEKFFEPFYTTKNEGMGLGIPIARSIVEQHGGRLVVVNTPDRGLKVSLCLPAFAGKDPGP